MSPADVWIVVLSWNRCEDTLACLRSLAAADLGGATVALVDNGSRDGTVDEVRRRFPAVHVIALAENEGYAGGNNAGIRAALAANAKAVLLLNNDTEVERAFLPPRLEALDDYPRAGAVSSAVMRFDSPEVLDAAYLQVTFRHGLVRRRGVNAMPCEGFDRIVPVPVGMGSSLLLGAEALRAVGLLDEDYFAYHEEVDWCFRARRAGFEVIFQPYSRVYHHGSRSTTSQPIPRRRDRSAAELPNRIPLTWSPVRTYLGARNEVRFVKKHAGPLRRLRYCISSAYHVPLEYLAAMMNREEDIWIGKWTYRRALAVYCREWNGSGSGRWWPLRVPRALFRDLPRDLRRARAEGITAQPDEYLLGLLDGFHDRPLPLERYGLW